MRQAKQIGGLSLTTEGYDNFVSLSGKEQLEQVYNSLSPKDYVQAEKALKGVPNGDNISGGMDKESKGDKPAGLASTGSDISGKGSKPSLEKGKD